MPDESQADVSVHGFWRWVTSAFFIMKIVDLDAGSYMHQTSAKAMAMAEKGKNYKYLHSCLNHKHSFTHMVYSMDGIPVTEGIEAQQCLASLLINKLKREYSEMCHFVRAHMSLSKVASNTLFLRGDRDKEAYIQQRPNMEDGKVMALLEP